MYIAISWSNLAIYNLFMFCDQAYEKKTTPKWRYDLGRKRNFEQVLNYIMILYLPLVLK